MGLLTEASQWPYRGIYVEAQKSLIMHGGIYLKRIEFWLLRNNKKNGLLYCFNAVGKEIEYGRD